MTVWGALIQPGIQSVYGASGLRTIIGGGSLSRPFGLTRSQAGGVSSTVLRGGVWSEVAADTARFDDSGLLIGGQRVNLLANVRTVGGTGWTNVNATPSAIIGPDGVASSASRFDEGTANSVHNTEQTTAISYTSGTSYVVSALVRPGTCTTCQLFFAGAAFGVQAFANFDLSGAGSVGTTGSAVTRANIRAAGTGWFWIEMAAPATATVSASAGTLAMSNSASAARSPSYTGTNRTLDAFWVWNEAAAFASTPVLPPVGSPAASTRGPDLVTATLASLGLPVSCAGTYFYLVMILQSAPASAAQMIDHQDDGSISNRYAIRNVAGGNTIQLLRSAAGADGTASLGTMTLGVPFTVVKTVRGDGSAAGSMNGGAVGTVTGGVTSGLTTYRIGQSAATTPLNGSIIRAAYTPQVYTDAQLQAASAAFV